MKQKNIFVFAVLIIASISASKAQTIYKDVAPIFYSNCTSCHHNGGIQFSLTRYSDVVANSSSILNDVQSNRMPPWPPEANYKHYAHERILSATDKSSLINWLNNGLTAGDTTLAPPVPNYTKAELYGTPDMIVKFPKFTSTSTTTDQYICLNIPINMPQDRYIRAFEYVPTNRAIIHHAVITIDTTNTAVNDLTGNCYNFQGQINIGDYAPGMGPTVFPGVAPTKLGIRLKGVSTLSLQLHVPENTAGQQDSSEVHLFFYPVNEPNIRPMYFETILQNWNFFIPANSVVSANAYYPPSSTMPIDVSLYSSFVHSHNTCTSIINYAFAGIDTIPLIKVPNWNFHWQGQYTFNKMVKLPVGYRLYSEHLYDNTSNNLLTPNHNVAVSPGLFTADEMLFDSYLFTAYQQGDENVDIASILAADPLFYPTSVTAIDNTILKVNVYPNPSNNIFNIDYSLMTAQYVQLSIYNLAGQQISKIVSGIEAAGNHTHQWNANDAAGKKLTKGIYLYQLQAGKKMMNGKIVVE
jgi:hypothetical protein